MKKQKKTKKTQTFQKDDLFNFSYAEEIIIKEFISIKKLSFDALYDDFIKTAPALNVSNRKANSSKFIDFIFTEKYPEYSKILNMFELIRKEFSKNGIEFIFDDSFEYDEYKIILSFSDFQELDNKLKIINDYKEKIRSCMQEIKV